MIYQLDAFLVTRPSRDWYWLTRSQYLPSDVYAGSKRMVDTSTNSICGSTALTVVITADMSAAKSSAEMLQKLILAESDDDQVGMSEADMRPAIFLAEFESAPLCDELKSVISKFLPGVPGARPVKGHP